MDLSEARRLLELKDPAPLSPAALRKRYLRLALRTHPDKNPQPDASHRFAQLGDAYAALLRAAQQDAAALLEQERTAALLALLLRALCGEDVAGELRALGEYQPPTAFGVDLTVRFDARVPSCGTGGSEHDQQPVLREAFADAFREEGLTMEGDPVGGYELPPDYEYC